MILFDSNILIYHLNGALPDSVLRHVEAWIAEGAAISVITRIEVLGFPQSANQIATASEMLAFFEEIPLSEPIVQRTIHLRQERTRENRSAIRLPDALIAATALELACPVATRNEADFRAIDGLTIANPFGFGPV